MGIGRLQVCVKNKAYASSSNVLKCNDSKNAHNCMNGGITSHYFNSLPPIFQDCAGQGPRYVELPNLVSEDITD